MDPFSLTVGALSIVGVSVGACAKLLHDIRGKYKNASLTIASMGTECVTIQAALYQIKSLTEKDSELYVSRLEVRPDLKYALDTAITGCTTTFAVLEDELGELAGRSTRKGKFQYLWSENTMQELLSQIRSQCSAINFLMMAIQTESIAQCADLIKDTVPVLQQIARQTKDLRNARPQTRQVPESIWSGSNSGSKLILLSGTEDSLEFSFDDQIIDSKAYRRALASAKSDAKSEAATKHSTSVVNPQRFPNVAEDHKEDKVSNKAWPFFLPGNSRHLQAGPVSEDEFIKTGNSEAQNQIRFERLSLRPINPVTDKPRPYTCGTCQRAFPRVEHLRRHECSHLDERPFECHECSRCFARYNLLLRHQEKLHMENAVDSISRKSRDSPVGSDESIASQSTLDRSDSSESEPEIWTTDVQDKIENANLREMERADTSFSVPSDDALKRNLLPSTPREFGLYFPSKKRLLIKHDDTTSDGNMNLRIEVETNIGQPGGGYIIQLYHLRMNDLDNRDFSLRRYCRDSGREECHYNRRRVKQYALEPEIGPTPIKIGILQGLRRAASSAISFGRRSVSTRSSVASLRGSSRHSSMSSRNGNGDSDDNPVVQSEPRVNVSFASNIIRMEFSNYAHVVIKRRGSTSSRRYEFEYWGSLYTWKRIVQKDDRMRNSYHLRKDNSTAAIAHIVSDLLTPSEMQGEEEQGYWVQPCSLWISDLGISEDLSDTGDVIVATGLAASIDDCLKRLSRAKRSKMSKVNKSADSNDPNSRTTCTTCLTQTTLSWRRDPDEQPLCDACGLDLKMHGIVRPLSGSAIKTAKATAEAPPIRNYIKRKRSGLGIWAATVVCAESPATDKVIFSSGGAGSSIASPMSPLE